MPIRPIEHGIFAGAAGGVEGFGYISGGSYYDPGQTGLATVDKFAFADDSRSTLGTGLSTSRKECAGMANEGSLA